MIGGLTNRFSARIGLLSSLLPYELQEFRGANEEETERIIICGPSRPRNFSESSRHFRESHRVSRQLSHGGAVSLKKQDAVLERLDRAEPNFERRDLDSVALVLEGSLAYSRI